MHAYCHRRTSAERAGDATAETFLAAWRRIDQAPQGSDALPWLYRIARGVVSNTRRSSFRARRLANRLASVGMVAHDIGGVSAGGGLAAGLALRARDEMDVKPVFQLLVYPMIDDRTAPRTDLDDMPVKLWNQTCNRFAWSSYLAGATGDDVHPQAAPSRAEDLSGLPPAWIGVGTLDLFHDEAVDYARRLQEAGVPCELMVVDGAFHGFDLGSAPVVQDFHLSQIDALRAALDPDPPG